MNAPKYLDLVKKQLCSHQLNLESCEMTKETCLTQNVWLLNILRSIQIQKKSLRKLFAKETETKIERTYVENLETRVSVMAEQAQQSEAKLKEDLDAKQDEIIRENKDNLDKLIAQYNQLNVQTETNTTDIKVYKDELEAAVKENERKIDEMNVTIAIW